MGDCDRFEDLINFWNLRAAMSRSASWIRGTVRVWRGSSKHGSRYFQRVTAAASSAVKSLFGSVRMQNTGI